MIARGNTVLTQDTLGLAFAFVHRLAERPKAPVQLNAHAPLVRRQSHSTRPVADPSPARLAKRRMQRDWLRRKYHARLARQECPRCGAPMPDATRRHCDACRAKAKRWPSRQQDQAA
jgi:hypothetical protein